MPYFVERHTDLTPKINGNVIAYTPENLAGYIDISQAVSKGFFGSGREQAGTRYYIRLDNNNTPLSNTVVTTRPTAGKWVDITESYKSQTPVDAYLLDETAIYLLIVTGNSIVMGVNPQAPPAGYQNLNPNNNKKVQWDLAETSLEVVDNLTSTNDNDRVCHLKTGTNPHSPGNFNCAVLIANELSRIIKQQTGKTIQFITINGATSGAMIQNEGIVQPELIEGANYNYLTQAIQFAKDYATSQSKTLKIGPVIGGAISESETINWASANLTEQKYRKNVFDFYNKLRASIANILTDNSGITFYRFQQHMQQASLDMNTMVKDIVLRSSSMTCPVIIPLYPCSILSNFDHIDTIGTFDFSGNAAKNIYRYGYLKKKSIFQPQKIESTPTSVTVFTNPPVAPLRIYTGKGNELNHGFCITDVNNVVQNIITNVSVSENKIVITTSSNPSGFYLQYKHLRPYESGPNPLQRSASHITDSDPYTYEGITIPNYLLSFKKII